LQQPPVHAEEVHAQEDGQHASAGSAGSSKAMVHEDERWTGLTGESTHPVKTSNNAINHNTRLITPPFARTQERERNIRKPRPAADDSSPSSPIMASGLAVFGSGSAIAVGGAAG